MIFLERVENGSWLPSDHGSLPAPPAAFHATIVGRIGRLMSLATTGSDVECFRTTVFFAAHLDPTVGAKRRLTRG